MTAIRVPLAAQPSQMLSIRLGQKSCRLKVYQKRTGLYLDAWVNDALVLAGALCRDRVWIVRSKANGFPGDLAFIDTQGRSDPEYTGLDARFQLLWEG
ncbi:hypothetical protein GCM10011349_19830 [Novosphingobium indicum]|uniref:Cyanophage baseplate Pam3 plug gp18 domain-containing protein n=1 Tax=Novosphingobium indicum TaxID=462949 RepID=A0ABQ2JN71_9SPHN|nr:hypothetical protein [Novosphingobium indicum]GGN49316.1 hypothetical protein GCM10011349_19830 [Novosphingobium indicum]